MKWEKVEPILRAAFEGRAVWAKIRLGQSKTWTWEEGTLWAQVEDGVLDVNFQSNVFGLIAVEPKDISFTGDEPRKAKVKRLEDQAARLLAEAEALKSEGNS